MRKPQKEVDLHNALLSIGRYCALRQGIPITACGWVDARHPKVLQYFHINEVDYDLNEITRAISSQSIVELQGLRCSVTHALTHFWAMSGHDLMPLQTAASTGTSRLSRDPRGDGDAPRGPAGDYATLPEHISLELF